jgi:hypothetical protein
MRSWLEQRRTNEIVPTEEVVAGVDVYCEAGVDERVDGRLRLERQLRQIGRVDGGIVRRVGRVVRPHNQNVRQLGGPPAEPPEANASATAITAAPMAGSANVRIDLPPVLGVSRTPTADPG